MASAARQRSPRPESRSVAGTFLHTRSGPLALDRVVVVGILNATPDSFSDGGRHLDPGRAADAAVAMVAAGARMLDVGAESTRPGAVPVAGAEEARRLLPVLRAVRRAVRVPLSIDTTKAAVARAALDSGADVVNDVSAGLADRAMLPLCAAAGVPVVLMHRRGTPRTMQRAPRYRDVVAEVAAFLAQRAAAATAAGVAPDAIVVDPGIGFGKTVAHNFELLRRLDELAAIGRPVLVGVSRKSSLGRIMGDPSATTGTTAASVGAAVAAYQHGAAIFRVHDVREHVEALSAAHAVEVGP